MCRHKGMRGSEGADPLVLNLGIARAKLQAPTALPLGVCLGFPLSRKMVDPQNRSGHFRKEILPGI
jgi:hypothetical protein